MYRAVLVDDEKYDLEGLRQLIPWQELGIEVVCSENRPLAALSYIDNHPIDILVTDIKMPVLTGLELSRKALEKNPNLRTIFISGYQDFEYAKEALNLKADGYILKPVDDNEIAALLSKVVVDINTERKKKQDESHFTQSFEFVKSDFLQHLLEGKFNGEALPAFLERHPLEIAIGAQANAVVLELDDVLWKNKQLIENGESELVRTMRQMTTYIKERKLGPWCEMSPSQIAFIYTGKASSLEDILIELNQYVRDNTLFTLTSSYGDVATFPDGISRSFIQAKELIGNKMFLGKNRIIPPTLSKLQIVKDAKDLNVILDAMFGAVAQYDLVKICDCMDDLFDNVRTFEHPVKVYSFSIHITSKLEAYLNTVKETFESLLGWGFEHLEVIRQFETVDDIKSWLRKTLFEISERLFLKKQNKSNRLIGPIEQYIQNHLADELTLREIANKFSYSANHMGFLFKDQTGESFNEYLVRNRMEMAKTLLQDPLLKIYEVADKVGYKSLAYFSRLFREHFGITPGDYRKQV
ncbi:helix-turn-helix domain-containing protein [Cohnella abietis]|uniref:DNA-binding response regulator n=1 Tax=Cohnella abietis TaxID=2507935 RepID=A0A3T1D028_9BACL|nr:helix-turn-helix domain-containing protein [Cohnella abietis]BBI31411.1 DNA-binding response regulator [Cohnella abietis]